MAKKKKLTLQEQLDLRVAKQPMRITHWFYHFVFKHFFMKQKYNVHMNIVDNINECKTGAFVLFNHLSRFDHIWVNLATYPRKFNMLAGHNEFFRSHLHWVFKMQRIIPKKIYTNDIPSMRAMKKILSEGGVVAFSPEGTSSVFGCNQPIVPGTGHFLKHYGLPVYYCKSEGAYLTQHKINNDTRKGRVDVTFSLLFSPEDLKNLTSDEIDMKINEAFRHDDYKWNKVQRVKYDTKGNAGDHYHDILYKCPKCGEEFMMIGEKNYIKCNHCGNGCYIDDYYDMIPFDDDCKVFETPTDWVDYERMDIIKAIRQDPNYSFTFDVKLGYLPPYRWVKDKKTTDICGEGKVTIDHQGFHFVGTKLGEHFEIHESYNTVYTLAIPTTMEFFGHYMPDGDYYEFFPLEPKVGKAFILVQEMHRLHVNKFKNFPWNDYMYEEKK